MCCQVTARSQQICALENVCPQSTCTDQTREAYSAPSGQLSNEWKMTLMRKKEKKIPNFCWQQASQSGPGTSAGYKQGIKGVFHTQRSHKFYEISWYVADKQLWGISWRTAGSWRHRGKARSYRYQRWKGSSKRRYTKGDEGFNTPRIKQNFCWLHLKLRCNHIYLHIFTDRS